MFDYEKRAKEKLQKALSELSPSRKKEVEIAFEGMMDMNFDVTQPPMRQMNFGGSYGFDANRTQVELDGTFSKDDLFRIAVLMS